MDSSSISFKAMLVGGQARTLQLSCITVSLEGGGRALAPFIPTWLPAALASWAHGCALLLLSGLAYM